MTHDTAAPDLAQLFSDHETILRCAINATRFQRKLPAGPTRPCRPA